MKAIAYHRYVRGWGASPRATVPAALDDERGVRIVARERARVIDRMGYRDAEAPAWQEHPGGLRDRGGHVFHVHEGVVATAMSKLASAKGRVAASANRYRFLNRPGSRGRSEWARHRARLRGVRAGEDRGQAGPPRIRCRGCASLAPGRCRRGTNCRNTNRSRGRVPGPTGPSSRPPAPTQSWASPADCEPEMASPIGGVTGAGDV
jgi:hypothetical protein